MVVSIISINCNRVIYTVHISGEMKRVGIPVSEVKDLVEDYISVEDYSPVLVARPPRSELIEAFTRFIS